MKFTLAHFSDVHLGPVPLRAGFRHFKLKRVIGIASWRIKRRKQHQPLIANALCADIHAYGPDHIACTGDLINISAHSEFKLALTWFEKVGDDRLVSLVPGNHDTYVAVAHEYGLGHFKAYMEGEMKSPVPARDARLTDLTFPYVRLRRNIALIGLNSGLPQPLFRASGELGSAQLADLRHILDDLRQRGYCRVVMIHHPPLPGLAPARRGLKDAAQFAAVLRDVGAELVIYGHNHRLRTDFTEGPSDPVPVMGISSASMRPGSHYDAAAWRMFSIDRARGQWQIDVIERQWNAADQGFATIREYRLEP